MPGPRLDASYVLPLRWTADGPLDELTAYLQVLATRLEVVVVDGSPPARFAQHHRAWAPFTLHLPPDPRFRFLNGKVNGVLTGMHAAGHEAVVLADDDVRYGWDELEQVVANVGTADVVRPQNYFDPLPWHARWDTARIVLNRATGGDFPGTLGVRRSTLLALGGYDGDVLFENLELMRTVQAAGGVVRSDPGCLVRRLPPTTAHFVRQRVRQAYDEWARPGRMVASLAVLPSTIWLAARGRYFSGRVVSLEHDPAKIEAWRTNVAEAGLEEWAQLVEGDAFETLPAIDDVFDVCFLDAEKDDYERLFQLARAKLEPGALIVADNVLSHADTLGAYAAARQADETLESVTVPLDRGLELSVVLSAARGGGVRG